MVPPLSSRDFSRDSFVMFQWGKAQGAKKVKLIPDGACLFTRGMGMTCNWTTERGFGERSWRYSMVVNDMKIEKMFVEPDFVENSGPDPFKVSDSTTMVTYLKSVQK
jgi:thioredoxin-dependent peroxiredoxin